MCYSFVKKAGVLERLADAGGKSKDFSLQAAT
jgi:hypothetical protein